jgi:hypothetical protein
VFVFLFASMANHYIGLPRNLLLQPIPLNRLVSPLNETL